ncbi:hypothetical protein J6590_002732 [Homalodisca vitripennis]|nr:hypothetical protein J6590_002732 [Homalodisca vitripennis]
MRSHVMLESLYTAVKMVPVCACGWGPWLGVATIPLLKDYIRLETFLSDEDVTYIENKELCREIQAIARKVP